MTKKKPATRHAARRAPVSPPAINITQNIDARGIADITLSKLRELLARADEQLRAELDRLVGRGTTYRASTPSQAVVRFWKVGADGGVVPDDATDWEGVYDASTGLIWGRRLLVGERNWSDSVKAAGLVTLCGAPARAPTIQERLSIVDYSRNEPALDIAFFERKETSAWEWTSTPASAPSGGAWLVDLSDGDSCRNDQGLHDRVRAVRAGQPSGLGL